jgi:sporulation protein YqfC
MKNYQHVLTRAAELFDLPGEVVAGLPKITMTGDRRIHIENHRGLLEYDAALISVNCGGAILCVYGARLELVSMTAEELLITGAIRRVEFE